MNSLYVQYLRNSNCPNWLVQLMLGHLALPSPLWNTPPRIYSFPPALVPIVSTPSGPCYYGYWRHWFLPRTPTYVELFIEPIYVAAEFAVTAQQFAARMILQLLDLRNGDHEAIRQFAQNLHINNYADLVEHWVRHGDREEGLSMLPYFENHLPRGRSIINPNYNGSFPPCDLTAKSEWLHLASSIEVHSYTNDSPQNLVSVPKYLTNENGFDIFQSYLDAQDLSSAWLSLNSRGWDKDDAQSAMEMLKTATDDTDFHLLADAWLAAAERFGYAY